MNRLFVQGSSSMPTFTTKACLKCPVFSFKYPFFDYFFSNRINLGFFFLVLSHFNVEIKKKIHFLLWNYFLIVLSEFQLSITLTMIVELWTKLSSKIFIAIQALLSFRSYVINTGKFLDININFVSKAISFKAIFRAVSYLGKLRRQNLGYGFISCMHYVQNLNVPPGSLQETFKRGLVRGLTLAIFWW